MNYSPTADTSTSTTTYVEVPVGAIDGMMPDELPANYLRSTPLTALLVLVLLVIAFDSTLVFRALKSYRHALWDVRSRGNLFDHESGVHLPTALLLGAVFAVFGGIVLYNWHALPADPSFKGAATSMALLAGYYLFQLCAYSLVGYTFATPDETRQWLAGFNATRAYAGILLAAPAILMIFWSDWHGFLLTVSISIYCIAHSVFILKGARIFYRSIGSLFYFILYLCTLEIIPLIILYHIAGNITGTV